MFRPLRRKTKELPREAAKALLKNERRGVLAVNGDDGYPFAIPINYTYNEEAGKIYFHGAKAGHKVDSLKRDDKVCFTVYGNETFTQGEWAPLMQSVVVFGRCRLIEDREITMQRVREIGLKYYPDAGSVEAELAKDFPAVQLYEIEIEHLCGKQIREK